MNSDSILHYRILEKLGEGGMGLVYKAEDTKLGRTVALKFLSPGIGLDSGEEARLLREATALSSLNHPNIATLFDLEESEGRRFIVMEYIDGVTLDDLAPNRTLTIRGTLDVAIQLADGLAYAHGRDVVHRDIKSRNIMLTADARLKILDFGLAKLRGAAQITRTGTTVGTASFMSPEQARGEDVDRRSDIWSFGVVLYQLLTGRLPFAGGYDAGILYAVVHTEPAPVEQLRSDLPAGMPEIVERCLRKNRDDRYQDVSSLLDDLRACRSRTGTGSESIPGAGLAPHRPSLRRPKILIPAAAAILILVGAVLFSTLEFGEPGNESDVSGATGSGKPPHVIYLSGLITDYLDSTGVRIPELAQHRLLPIPETTLRPLEVQIYRDAIGILYPDPVITADDAERTLLRKGIPVTRKMGRDESFYAGELGCSSAVMLNVFRVEPRYEGADYILVPNFFLYSGPYGGVGGMVEKFTNPKDLPDVVRSLLGTYREIRRKIGFKAIVLSATGDKILISRPAGWNLQPGTMLSAQRTYSGTSGYRLRLEDLDEEIEYYRQNKGWEAALKKKLAERKSLEESASKAIPGAWSSGLGLSFEVIEVLDSTAICVLVERSDPWERPKPGDILSLR